MDFLDDPETKAKYDKCKLTVKIWEHKFIKKYKRIPSKLDIRDSSIEVRHAYRKYFQIKSAALEQNFMDIEGFEDEKTEEETITQPVESEDSLQGFIYSTSQNSNEGSSSQDSTQDDNSDLVRKLQEIRGETELENDNDPDIWGSHLNNHKPLVKEVEKSQNSSLTSITNKLFSGSKFNKRNPRKSLGKSLALTQKNKSDNAIDSPKFLSQPTPSMYSGINDIQKGNPNVKISAEVAALTQRSFSHSVPINPINSLENKFNSSLRKVDKGWLQRVNQNTGSGLYFDCDNSSNNVLKTKVDYSSDSDIIESSDDERTKTPTLHVAKKMRLSFMPNNLISATPGCSFKVLNQEVNSKNTHSFALDSGTVGINSNSNTCFNPVSNANEIKNNACNDKVKEVDIKNNECEEGPQNVPINHEVKELGPVETTQLVESTVEDLEQLKTKNVLKTSRTTKTETSNKYVTKSKPKDNLALSKSAKKSKTFKRKSVQPEGDNTVSPRRSSRNNKTKISFEELNSSEEDPFHSDNDDKDPEFTIDSEAKVEKNVEDIMEVGESPLKKKVLKKVNDKSTGKGRKVSGVNFELRAKVKRKTKDSKEDLEKQDTVNSQKYELEYSVKPRVVAPRYSNLVKVLTEKCQNKQSRKKNTNENESEVQGVKNDKKMKAQEKLEKKIAAGQLNDNFVTINLRKKVFVKGKSNYSFSKYKKSQWKAKKKALYGPDMDMSGCDGGKLMCFSCGKEGHFAARCPNKKGDELLPMDIEEECEIMSLEEAQQLALNSNLSVRKPKIVTDSTDKEGDVNSRENNDNSNYETVFDDDIDDILLAEALKLEEYVKKLDVNGYVDNLEVVEPYFPEENHFKEAPKEVYDTLQQFGHTSFRGGQEKAIMRILQGKSSLVTLATGTGKSLCYQLPALLYARRGGKPSITLVISPLVSLMEDQVVGIPRFLKAACLHTNQTETNRQKIIEALEANQLDVLLISPEAIVVGEKQTGFRSLFRKLPPIAFACIDEVHCISQWSHNFRPSYLMVSRVLRESLGVKTILGLTATATRATCENIIELLGIPDGLEGIIKDTPLPENLHLTVSKDAARDRALLNLLTSDKFKELKSIIVYCTRRDECERIAAFLRTSLKEEAFEGSGGQKNKRKRFSVQAEPYHAGLSGSRRRTIQNAFMSGDLRIVVATVAFGMGINKSDIRAVIHFNMPNSFESYVQEVGRAGRDGLPAYCHVFLDSQARDESELCRHIHANSIDRHVIRKLLQKVFVPCSCKGTCPKHEVAFSIEESVRALDIPEENITTLLCYLELHKNKYIELLSPAYTKCKVVSYGGLNHVKKAAKDCPPLAMALAMYPSKKDNVLEFPIVDVASAIGWESGICKHKLKNLEWTSENNVPKRSFLSVKFSNLGFRFLAPGNLVEDKLDEALDTLYSIVVNQEEKALKQLTAVHNTLISVAEKSYHDCISEEKMGKEELKLKIREYFGAEDPLANVVLESSRELNNDQLVNDIRAMVCMYRDNQFTGRALARIFHGIQSPNYPAVIWGKCKFWRSHLHEDFHEICKIASREIIRLR